MDNLYFKPEGENVLLNVEERWKKITAFLEESEGLAARFVEQGKSGPLNRTEGPAIQRSRIFLMMSCTMPRILESRFMLRSTCWMA